MVTTCAPRILLAIVLVFSVTASGHWLEYWWTDINSLAPEGLFSGLVDLEGDCVLFAPDPDMGSQDIEIWGHALKNWYPDLPIILCSFRKREYVVATEAVGGEGFTSGTQGIYLHDLQAYLWVAATYLNEYSTIQIVSTGFTAAALEAMFDGDWTQFRMFLPDHPVRHGDLQVDRGRSVAKLQWMDLLAMLHRRRIKLYYRKFEPRSLIPNLEEFGVSGS